MESQELPQIIPMAILTLISIIVFLLVLCGARFFRGRRLLVVNLAFWCQPLLMLLGLQVTWAMAWLLLGHLPRPNFDDPKSISDWLAIPFLLTFALGCASFVTVPGTILLTSWLVVRREWSRGRAALCLGSFVMLWGGVWLYAAFDPFEVIVWYLD